MFSNKRLIKNTGIVIKEDLSAGKTDMVQIIASKKFSVRRVWKYCCHTNK